MKKELLFALFTVVILLLYAEVLGAAGIDDLVDSLRYDVSAERTFEGTVHDKPRLFEGQMYLTLRTTNGMVAVRIGPKAFVERNGFRFEAGQMVTVVGMPVVISNREMVVARQITMNGSVFVVRDRNGQPIWKLDRPVEMDPELGGNGLPVC